MQPRAHRPSRVLLFAAALALSCESPGTSPTNPSDPNTPTDPAAPVDPTKPRYKAASGSRLIFRETRYKSDDGAELVSSGVTVYDSKLKTECVFYYNAEDGVQRCLPSTTATLSAGYFEDSACTVPVAISYADCKADTFIAESIVNPAGCGSALRIYELGTEIPINTMPLYSKNSSMCMQTSTRVSTGARKLYRIGRKLDASEFVKVTMETRDIVQ